MQPRIRIPVYHYGATFRDDPALSMQTNLNANPKSRARRAKANAADEKFPAQTAGSCRVRVVCA